MALKIFTEHQCNSKVHVSESPVWPSIYVSDIFRLPYSGDACTVCIYGVTSPLQWSLYCMSLQRYGQLGVQNRLTITFVNYRMLHFAAFMQMPLSKCI